MIFNDKGRQIILMLIRHHDKSKARRGRPQNFSNECYLDLIMETLITGQQWYAINGKYRASFLPHYTGVFKKMQEWGKAGIFEEAYNHLFKLKKVLKKIGGDFFIDTNVFRNINGIDQISSCYKIKCKKSSKLSVIVDRNGIPVSFHLSESRIHDVRLILPTINNLKIKKSLIKNLVGDKGYCSKQLKQQFRQEGINYLYPQKNNFINPEIITPENRQLLSSRYIVENLFSWVFNYRRLSTRLERKIVNYKYFLCLAFVNIITNKIYK